MSGQVLNDIGRWFYRLGNSFCKLGDIEKALRSWNDAFLVRGCEFSSDKDYEWKKFHDIQFAIYLLGKKRLCVSLSEGDMIHDLIRMKWEELKNAIAHFRIQFRTDNTGACIGPSRSIFHGISMWRGLTVSWLKTWKTWHNDPLFAVFLH
jgi:hypothetical protein